MEIYNEHDWYLPLTVDKSDMVFTDAYLTVYRSRVGETDPDFFGGSPVLRRYVVVMKEKKERLQDMRDMNLFELAAFKHALDAAYLDCNDPDTVSHMIWTQNINGAFYAHYVITKPL